jgi:hypothetical protein
MPAVAAAAVWGCHVEEKLLGASAGAIARPDWEDAIARSGLGSDRVLG